MKVSIIAFFILAFSSIAYAQEENIKKFGEHSGIQTEKNYTSANIWTKYQKSVSIIIKKKIVTREHCNGFQMYGEAKIRKDLKLDRSRRHTIIFDFGVSKTLMGCGSDEEKEINIQSEAIELKTKGLLGYLSVDILYPEGMEIEIIENPIESDLLDKLKSYSEVMWEKHPQIMTELNQYDTTTIIDKYKENLEYLVTHN